MAVSEEIYANVEFDYDTTEAADGIEDIYLNKDIIDSQYSEKTTEDFIPKRIPLATYPETESAGRKSTRGVAVCLGLLSILLLAGTIGLLVYYNREIDSFKEKITQFQTRYNNMTEERDQFQTRYDEMTEERNQLQTRYNEMTEERDQFQTRYNEMTKEFLVERDNLRTNLSLVDQHVQQGWRYYNSSLYFISTAKKSWEDSRRDCEEKNADLLIIKSREEQDFLHRLKKEAFWIGLTDKEQEGKWMWVDGTELTTGYWAGGQPDKANVIQEDCAVRWLAEQSLPEKSWHDVSCSQLMFWLCGKKVYL